MDTDYCLEFLDIRIPTAMKQIHVDMSFVILAISLIVGVCVSNPTKDLSISLVLSGYHNLSSLNHCSLNDQYLCSSLICLRVFRL